MQAAGAGNNNQFSTGCSSPRSRLGLQAQTSAELGALLPRVWRFLPHTLSGVRLAAAQCLARLLPAWRAGPPPPWLLPLVAPMLRLLLQARTAWAPRGTVNCCYV
jgi:hypothetical protein